MNQEQTPKKKVFECSHCHKKYKTKRYFEKHFQKCQEEYEKELEVFNYQGIIDEIGDIDPDFVKQFQLEIDLLTDNHTF